MMMIPYVVFVCLGFFAGGGGFMLFLNAFDKK
jgi:hypothetical protein